MAGARYGTLGVIGAGRTDLSDFITHRIDSTVRRSATPTRTRLEIGSTPHGTGTVLTWRVPLAG